MKLQLVSCLLKQGCNSQHAHRSASLQRKAELRARLHSPLPCWFGIFAQSAATSTAGQHWPMPATATTDDAFMLSSRIVTVALLQSVRECQQLKRRHGRQGLGQDQSAGCSSWVQAGPLGSRWRQGVFWPVPDKISPCKHRAVKCRHPKDAHRRPPRAYTFTGDRQQPFPSELSHCKTLIDIMNTMREVRLCLSASSAAFVLLPLLVTISKVPQLRSKCVFGARSH